MSDTSRLERFFNFPEVFWRLVFFIRGGGFSPETSARQTNVLALVMRYCVPRAA